MGTPSIGVKQTRSGRRHVGFRRLFIWYFLAVLVVTFVLSGLIEGVLVYWVVLAANRGIPFVQIPSVRVLIVLFLMIVPIIVFLVVLLFFARLLGRRVSRPVEELRQAVEKIRRRDLDFVIGYHEADELGDLCVAFNELSRELRGSLEREWRKQEEMRTMIAALSHDLRTPVTIIQGHIESLARTEDGEKRQQRLERYLPVLEASSQRMTRLLNDMLLVSALEQTDFVIQPQPVDLAEELRRKAQVYQLQATAQEIAFFYTYHHSAALSRIPAWLDFHRVEQILDNLFENALRYTPTGGQISLVCVREAREVVFELRDSGCGLDPVDMPHLCEKFYRGRRQPAEKKHKAAGLGLYTCKLLAERHGGTILLRNHPAGGCEAVVRLPLSQK